MLVGITIRVKYYQDSSRFTKGMNARPGITDPDDPSRTSTRR